MSRPIASGLPAALASSAAPTAPPAGPESTLQAPARAASAASAVPPEERITSGSAQAALAAGAGEAGQVAAEQGGEVGVDHGGGEALVLAEGRQHLVRGGDVDVGQRLAQRRARCAARAPDRWKANSRQTATDSISRPRSSPTSRSTSSSASSSTTPTRPTRSGGLEPRSSTVDQRPRPARQGW